MNLMLWCQKVLTAIACFLLVVCRLLGALPILGIPTLLILAVIGAIVVTQSVSLPVWVAWASTWQFALAFNIAVVTTYYAAIVVICRAAIPVLERIALPIGGQIVSEPLVYADAYKTAIHEAGHIISYALYKYSPDTLSSRVHRRGGYVRPFYQQGEPRTTRHLLVRMATDLAGTVADKVLLGETQLGADTDLQDWEYRAKRYLTHEHTDLPWYAVPENNHEAAINHATLDQLKTAQTALITTLIQHNAALVREIAGVLAKRLTLDDARIRAYLARVIIPTEIRTKWQQGGAL